MPLIYKYYLLYVLSTTLKGGMQLGMGDFIFYGIFIGLTCNNDSVISLACIMAIVYVSEIQHIKIVKSLKFN